MRRKVTFQSRSTERSPEGQLLNLWNDIYSVGADIRWVAGSETRTERFAISTNQILVTIPYSLKALDIVQDNAFLVSDKRYAIDNIDVDTKWRHFVLIRGVAFNQRGM